MLCCAGLIGGSIVGQALGGPWTYIGPAAGFGIGLVADVKLMHRFHQKSDAPQTDTAARAKADADPPGSNSGTASAPTAQSGACCGIASGLARLFTTGERKANQALPPAAAGANSRTSFDAPSQLAQPPLAEAAPTVGPTATDRAKPT